MKISRALVRAVRASARLVDRLEPAGLVLSEQQQQLERTIHDGICVGLSEDKTRQVIDAWIKHYGRYVRIMCWDDVRAAVVLRALGAEWLPAVVERDLRALMDAGLDPADARDGLQALSAVPGSIRAERARRVLEAAGRR